MTTWAESGLPEEDKFKENIEPWRLCYFRTVVDIMTAELNEIEEKKQPQDLSFYDWIWKTDIQSRLILALLPVINRLWSLNYA